MRTYSGQLSGVLRLKFLRSMVASLALRWERTLLTSNLMSSIEPVGVPTSLGYVMLLPQVVMCVRLALSPFSGWTLQTTLEEVISLRQLDGILL